MKHTKLWIVSSAVMALLIAVSLWLPSSPALGGIISFTGNGTMLVDGRPIDLGSGQGGQGWQ